MNFWDGVNRFVQRILPYTNTPPLPLFCRALQDAIYFQVHKVHHVLVLTSLLRCSIGKTCLIGTLMMRRNPGNQAIILCHPKIHLNVIFSYVAL